MVQSVETVPETRPLGQIQADMFCAGCGYNLFSQAVLRDPQMGILVCRCPECGKFNPAGVATDAAARWRHSLGVWLLILRVAVIFSTLVTALILMGVLPYAMAEDMVRFCSYRMYYTPQTWSERLVIAWAVFAAASLGLGLATGICLVVSLYHWRRSFYRLALFCPMLSLLVAGICWHFDHSGRGFALFRPIGGPTSIEAVLQQDAPYQRSSQQLQAFKGQLQNNQLSAELQKQMDQRRQELQASLGQTTPLASPAVHMATMVGLVTVGMLLGTLFGRPVTRGLLRMFLPARALQTLAMLWFIDGKVPPQPATSVVTGIRSSGR